MYRLHVCSVRDRIQPNVTRGNVASLFGQSDAPPTVSEVVAILDMWSFIEKAHDRFSAEEKERVKAEADPYGGERFTGFDCHAKPEHIAAPRFLIDDLGRFTKFRRRHLYSQPSSLGEYQHMYRVFQPIRKTLLDRCLTANEMIQVLNERRTL